MVRVSIVSYTNTLPFRWALKHGAVRKSIVLEEDIPSVCAQKLLNDKVDLALVPVAVLPLLKDYHIVSDYCIGADGIVDSVKLYSQKPLREVKAVMLDYQSRTSVALAQLLLREYWKVTPRFVAATEGFEQTISGDTAAVVIGDRTFSLNGRFAYEFDLAQAWKAFTGLPFVFAAWVCRRMPDRDFLSEFNAALAYGVDNVDRAIEEEQLPAGLTTAVAHEYLTARIDYRLDDRKREALALFLRYLAGKESPRGNG